MSEGTDSAHIKSEQDAFNSVAVGELICFTGSEHVSFL